MRRGGGRGLTDLAGSESVEWLEEDAERGVDALGLGQLQFRIDARIEVLPTTQANMSV